MIDIRDMIDEAVGPFKRLRALNEFRDDGKHSIRDEILSIGPRCRDYKEYPDEPTFDVSTDGGALDNYRIDVPFNWGKDTIRFEDGTRWGMCRFKFFSGNDGHGRLAIKVFAPRPRGSKDVTIVKMCSFAATIHQVVSMYQCSSVDSIFPATITLFENDFDNPRERMNEGEDEEKPRAGWGLPRTLSAPYGKDDLIAFVNEAPVEVKDWRNGKPVVKLRYPVSGHWRDSHDSGKLAKTLEKWGYDIGSCILIRSAKWNSKDDDDSVRNDRLLFTMTDKGWCVLWNSSRKQVYDIYVAGLWTTAIEFFYAHMKIPRDMFDDAVDAEFPHRPEDGGIGPAHW